jgi:hypothetical protein
METEKVKALIEAGLPGAKVDVTGDGGISRRSWLVMPSRASH